MVTEVVAETGLVVIVNVALNDPAGMVTLAGTWAAAALLLWRVTTAPPVGAAAVRVAVPIELFPPTTEAGVFVTLESAIEVTVNVVVWVEPYVPEIVTFVLDETGLVVIVKVALVAPAAMLTLAGT
jgi:hypothetical protein